MTIANSISFFAFGIIMRFLPVVAPTLVAPGALNVHAAEATTRGMWLVVMGYALGSLGAWFLLKEMVRQSGLAIVRARQYIEALREARELARSRHHHARTVAARVAVRVQY